MIYCPYCGQSEYVVVNKHTKLDGDCYCDWCVKIFHSPTDQTTDSPGPVEGDDDRQTAVRRRLNGKNDASERD